MRQRRITKDENKPGPRAPRLVTQMEMSSQIERGIVSLFANRNGSR